MKRFTRIFLSALAAVTLAVSCLAGCSQPGADTSSPAASGADAATASMAGFKIGMRFPVTIDSMQQQTLNNVKAMVEAAGGTLLVENAPLTPEGNIQAYERLIAAGADGLLVIPAADSVLPRIKQMCEKAEIPWAIYYRSILDQDIKAEVEASPYYLGNTYEDEFDAGYELTKKMGEAGCKNIVLFSTALGDTTGEQREAGMSKACEEYSINIINEFRGVAQASDAAQSIESVLTTRPEVDGIFICAGTITPGILPALTNLLEEYDRKDIKITIIDFPQGLQDAFAEGYMLAACGGHNVTDPQFSMALLLNAVKGTKLSDKPCSVRISQMYLESEEDVINYFKYCENGVSTYTIEEAQKLFFKFETPEITLDSFMKIAESYTIDDVVARHKDLIK